MGPESIIGDTFTIYTIGMVSYPYHLYITRKNFSGPDKWLKIRMRAVKRTTRTSLNFGKWGFLYTAWTAVIAHLRNKDDGLTSCLAGGMVTGTLQKSRDPKSFMKNYQTGFIFFAILETAMWYSESDWPNPMDIVETIPGNHAKRMEDALKQVEAQRQAQRQA